MVRNQHRRCLSSVGGIFQFFSLSLRTNLLNCFVWLVSLQHLPLSFEFLFFFYFTEVVSPSQDLIDSQHSNKTGKLEGEKVVFNRGESDDTKALIQGLLDNILCNFFLLFTESTLWANSVQQLQYLYVQLFVFIFSRPPLVLRSHDQIPSSNCGSNTLKIIYINNWP